jgi:hypothetical protein
VVAVLPPRLTLVVLRPAGVPYAIGRDIFASACDAASIRIVIVRLMQTNH